MGLFDQTFVDPILIELQSRKFNGLTGVGARQNVLIPHVRMTALVAGELSGIPLHGFTLGNVDVSKTPSIDDYFNTNGQGTAIGLTYTGPEETAVQVILDGKDVNKKLPPPGVTGVTISTQSTGGFVFNATIKLKFYGKEQYDFIWQILLRPGNPIFLEYGHTRAHETQKDLGFFQKLDQTLIDDCLVNLRNNVAFKTTTNSGRVMGLVTNFKVRLNENNEYEAEIQLKNALEFIFTISPENTFMSWGPNADIDKDGTPRAKGLRYLSKSIKSNFGWESGEDYDPKLDNIFKQVLKDAVEREDPPAGWPPAAAGGGTVEPSPDWRKYILIPYGIVSGDDETVATGGSVADAVTESDKLRQSDMLENSGNVYISLEYFLSKLLNDIINISYYDRENAVQCGISGTAAGRHDFTPSEIKGHEKLREEEIDLLQGFWATMGTPNARHGGIVLPTTGERMDFNTGGGLAADKAALKVYIEEKMEYFRTTQATWTRMTQAVELGQSATRIDVEINPTQQILPVGYWPNLRSTNIKNVIINNDNIYNDLTGATSEIHPATLRRMGNEGKDNVKHHNGCDYAYNAGTEILACADGTISQKRFSTSFGNVIGILHPDDFYSLYAHMEGFADVHIGDSVNVDDVIGYVGNTGSSTAAHLHFELTKGTGAQYMIEAGSASGRKKSDKHPGGATINPRPLAWFSTVENQKSKSRFGNPAGWFEKRDHPEGYKEPFAHTNVSSEYGYRVDPMTRPTVDEAPNQPIPADVVKAHLNMGEYKAESARLIAEELSGYFYRTSQEGYSDRFGDDYENSEIVRMFKFNRMWKQKKLYKYSAGMVQDSGGVWVQAEDSEVKKTNFEGIYVNYEKVRNAFIGSRSIGEAIQKVLNMVNSATAGILKLKMRFLNQTEISEGIGNEGLKELVSVNRIKIYDENALAGPKEKQVIPYKFFTQNISEAVSYNFDFSLPNSVAATVVANTFQATEMSAAGGDPEKKMQISYGYALDSNLQPAIVSLVNLNNEEPAHGSALSIHDHAHDDDTGSTTGEGDVEDEESKGIEEFEEDEFYRAILGYKEFDPPKMMEKAIRTGLYNVLPSAGRINIKLQGLDGFRFGDMFTVLNILPYPFDNNSIFMLTGYKHDISSQGWFTEIDGTMFASIPDNIKEIQAALRAFEDNANKEESPVLLGDASDDPPAIY